MNTSPEIQPAASKVTLSRALFSLVALVAMLLAGQSAIAQTLKLQFGFEDTGTTTVDSVNAVSLATSNAAGTLDLHSAAGMGVGGLGKALDYTFNGTHGGTGGSVAFTANNSAISFGAISTFTMTLWIKPATNLNNNPRFFYLGPAGTADINTTNTIGIQGNQTSSGTSCQTFLHALNNIFSGLNNMPSNRWSFLAFTYNGTNLVVYNASETNSVGAGVIATRTNLIMNPGTNFRLYLGNNNALNRSFNGMMDDVRFYTGAGDGNFVESVRKSAVPDPYVLGTVILPTTVVTVGGSVTMSASVSGTAPFFYQWISNGVPLLNATNVTLVRSNLQVGDSGNYSLIVSNNPGGLPSVVTNASATLTVRVPADLTWAGVASEWETFSIAWDSNNDSTADTNYLDGDRVFFNNVGLAQSDVYVGPSLYPTSLTVSNTAGHYTLTGGPLAGGGSLIKRGSSNLVLAVDNTMLGGTLINGGILTVGDGVNALGGLGTGNVTNNTGLKFNRPGAVTVLSAISGVGDLTQNVAGDDTVGTVTLSGSNTYSGSTYINGGTLELAHSSALGSSPGVTATSTTGGAYRGTRLGLSGGVTISGKTYSMTTLLSPDYRCALAGTGNAGVTNVWAGPIVLNGDGRPQIIGADGTTLIVSGNISGAPNTLLLRGGGSSRGVVSGTITLGASSVLQTADGSTWLISSTGNTWGVNRLSGESKLVLGANNALPTSSALIGESVGNPANQLLDLNGFNQMLAEMNTTAITITNRSATTDSTLTYNSATNSTFGGVIRGGTPPVHLTVASGELTLTNSGNTYRGNTTINGGTLLLLSSGAIPNSAVIAVGEDGTLDVSTRNDGKLTLNPGQTLMGSGIVQGDVVSLPGSTLAAGSSIGTLTINGDLTLGGNLAVELDKSSSPSNDLCQIVGTATNAGSGWVTVANLGPALANGNKFTLFSQPLVNGGSVTITPAPGVGLSWSNRLAIDGSIMVITTPATSYTERLYAVAEGTPNKLISFQNNAPGNILSEVSLSVDIFGIDFVGGTLYGVGSSNLYTIDRVTGATALVGSFSPVFLNGAGFGVEAEPSGIRVVSDLDQQIVLNYGTGAATEGTTLVGGAATTASGMAYHTGTGVRYVIDTGSDTLNSLDPVTGLLTSIGLFAADISRRNGFDISGKAANGAYVVSTAGSSGPSANLYTIDLATGVAQLQGLVGDGDPLYILRGLAVGPEFSVSTSSINTTPTNITSIVVGGTNLVLLWPSDHLGWTLQKQTNSLAIGLRTNWVDVAGSSGMTATNFPILKTDPTVFYRLQLSVP